MAEATGIFRQKGLIERYNNLPSDVRQAFFNVDIADRIMKIGQNAKLTIEQIGEVANATGLFMLGMISPNEFTPRLQVLKIESQTAKSIAAEINQQIFLPIRESLKGIHHERWSEDLTAGAETTAQVSKPAEKASAQTRPNALAPTSVPLPPQISQSKTLGDKPRPAPLSLKDMAYATPKPPQERKPEPLIIRPLQSARRETPPEIPDIFKPAPAPIRPSIPTPKPTEPKPPAPMSAPRPPQATPVSAIETAPAAAKPIEEKTGVRDQALSASEEKPAPIISPLGLSPAAPMPPKAIYEKAKDTFNKELKEFRKDETAKETNIAEAAKEGEGLTPSLLPAGMITKKELQKEIDKFRGQGTRDQALGAGPAEEQRPSAIQPTQPKPAATPKTAVRPSPPLKLPQQKIPKPPAPEKYEEDPYREPQE